MCFGRNFKIKHRLFKADLRPHGICAAKNASIAFCDTVGDEITRDIFGRIPRS